MTFDDWCRTLTGEEIANRPNLVLAKQAWEAAEAAMLQRWTSANRELETALTSDPHRRP